MTHKAGCLVLGVVLTGLIAACSNNNLPVRYKESGLNSGFRYSGMAYPEYVAHMRRVISQARRDLTPENRDQVVDWNSPYIMEPDPAKCPAAKGNRIRSGILLIHGLTDSPFEMRDLGKHFQEQCFLVYGLLLPGHGTVPGDLLSVTYEDWAKATQYGLAALRPRVEKLYAGGFSTGGALLVQAALTGEKLDGLFLFAPALGLHSSVAFIAPVASGVQSWVDIAPDEDPTKYESFATNAAAQIWQLVHDLSFRLNRDPLPVPVFLAVSEDDQTIDPATAIAFFSRVTDARSRAVIYGKGGKPQDLRFIPTVAARPAEQILDMAHLSLTIAPENPHYGKNGDYRNCLHYLKDESKWKACKQGRGPAGEITKNNLNRGVMRRLTYNPDYVHMVQEMDAFLARLN